MDKEIILRTENLSKSFGNKLVVQDVNMNVMKGDIYGFLGPNGAGKTTSIKLMLGYLKATKGEVYINNRSISRETQEALDGVGAMIETPRFYENLTGRDNLKVIAELYGKKAKSMIAAVLEMVELEEAANKKVGHYSLGMKQRLGIARAFINDPELIILDEPTNGLDPYGMKSIRDLIIKLSRKYNKTFIISTHILTEVELMCNRFGVIHNGIMVKELTMEQLEQEKPQEETFEDYFIELTSGGRKYA